MRGAKSWVQVAFVGAVAVLGSVGCGASEVGSRGPAAPQAAVAPDVAAPVAPREMVTMGPTEGASTDPAILAWQNDLLRAVGRDGQHMLFSLALVEDGAGQAVYVGFDPSSLGLSKEERSAAEAVQAKYAESPLHVSTHGNLWVASLLHDNAAPDVNGKTASR